MRDFPQVPRADFDAAYRRGQIAAHEEALKVQTAYAAQGRDAATRPQAQRAMLLIRKHLDAAGKLAGA